MRRSVRHAASSQVVERQQGSRRGGPSGGAAGRMGSKRARRSFSEPKGSPGSSESRSTRPAQGRRGEMDPYWASMSCPTPKAQEFQYTEGIDISEGLMPPPSHIHVHVENAEGAGPNTGTRRKAGKGKSVKQVNFSTMEDETLCSTYLNVSKDPIVGVNQPQGAYWARIKYYFHQHKKTNIERTQSALAHRWGDIQKDTTRFCSFLSRVERKNRSGLSEADKVREALQMYEKLVGTQFKFYHCWTSLKDEHKWNLFLAQLWAKQEGEGTEDTTDSA